MKKNREQEIARLVARLEVAWRSLPQLRLGQLIVNATPARFNGDPFHLADADLIREVERYAGREIARRAAKEEAHGHVPSPHDDA